MSKGQKQGCLNNLADTYLLIKKTYFFKKKQVNKKFLKICYIL